MTNFFSYSYWFNMRPESLHYSGILFFIILILILFSIIFLYNIAKKRKNNIYFRIWRNLNSFAITNLIIAFFLLFFEYEELYIFSARFWLIIWALLMFAWLFFIIKDYKKIPEIKKKYAEDQEFRKYIP